MQRTPLVAVLLLTPAIADAAPWVDATAGTLGTTAEWSNKVELVDIDEDGDVDVIFANGAGYSMSEGAEPNRVFLNEGSGLPMTEGGAAIFGPTPDSARVVKVRDVDGDGRPDIFVGTTWETQSRLYVGSGGGVYTEVTDTQLPADVGSFGDAEFGDVDGDGDLDLVLADWGAGNPSSNGGGRTRLWRNDGVGLFTDATTEAMPDVLVGWSWELEVQDVDNDLDLDVLVSCKSCSGSYLFENDGTGVFADVTAGRMPQLGNNYEFEAMDLNGDGFLDLVTINDHSPGTRDGVFLSDGAGGFTDATATSWPNAENPAGDDNMVAFLDHDSDGDADFVVAGLFGQPDRLLVNDGTGVFTELQGALPNVGSDGTLGIAVADFDGDMRLDVVLAEGEAAFPDFLFLGMDIPVDTAPPVVDLVEQAADGVAEPTIRARVHDRKSPIMDHDFQKVVLEWVDPSGSHEVPMNWYGGYLWRAALPPDAQGEVSYRVCATDAAGNDTCSAALVVALPGGGGSGSGGSGSGGSGASGDGTSGGGSAGGTASSTGTGGTAGTAATDGGSSGGGGEGGGGGCGCVTTTRPARGLAALCLLLLPAVRRRALRRARARTSSSAR